MAPYCLARFLAGPSPFWQVLLYLSWFMTFHLPLYLLSIVTVSPHCIVVRFLQTSHTTEPKFFANCGNIYLLVL